jgi:hypothetical protein
VGSYLADDYTSLDPAAPPGCRSLDRRRLPDEQSLTPQILEPITRPTGLPDEQSLTPQIQAPVSQEQDTDVLDLAAVKDLVRADDDDAGPVELDAESHPG